MSEGPIGLPPNSASSESLQPLKLIEYPPKAFFFAIGISSSCVSLATELLRLGVLLPRVRGGTKKKSHRWGLAPLWKNTGEGYQGVSAGGPASPRARSGGAGPRTRAPGHPPASGASAGRARDSGARTRG